MEAPRGTALHALGATIGQKELPTARVRFHPTFFGGTAASPRPRRPHAPRRLEHHVDPAPAVDEGKYVRSLFGQHGDLGLPARQSKAHCPSCNMCSKIRSNAGEVAGVGLGGPRPVDDEVCDADSFVVADGVAELLEGGQAGAERQAGEHQLAERGGLSPYRLAGLEEALHLSGHDGCAVRGTEVVVRAGAAVGYPEVPVLGGQAHRLGPMGTYGQREAGLLGAAGVGAGFVDRVVAAFPAQRGLAEKEVGQGDELGKARLSVRLVTKLPGRERWRRSRCRPHRSRRSPARPRCRRGR